MIDHISLLLNSYEGIALCASVGFFGLFNKTTKQTTNTTNVDRTTNTTLTNSNNRWTSNNVSLTNAESNVYNSVFDATDAFNTVSYFSFGKESQPDDFMGLSNLLDGGNLAKDPNANKYDFNFADNVESGSDFLDGVSGVVRETWEGMEAATLAIPVGAGAESGRKSNVLLFTVVTIVIIFVSIFAIKKGKA